MKKNFFLFLAVLVFCSLQSVNAAEKTRIAVIPFKAGQGVSKPEASYLTDRVRSGLIDADLFEVISNDQIQEMMKMKEHKQKIGSGTCTSQKCIIDLGNALECEKMIVGSAAGAFGEFTISVKMLDVVKQKYELAKEISIKSKKGFPDAARKIVKLIAGVKRDDGATIVSQSSEGTTYTGMLWRTVVLPGWGHLHSNQTRGYLYGGLWAGIGGAFLWSHLNYQSKQDDYNNATSDFSSSYDASKSAYNLRGYLSLAFIGMYVITISDMLLTGKKYISTNSEVSSNDIQVNVFFGAEQQSHTKGNRPDERLEFRIKKSF